MLAGKPDTQQHKMDLRIETMEDWLDDMARIEGGTQSWNNEIKSWVWNDNKPVGKPAWHEDVRRMTDEPTECSKNCTDPDCHYTH